MWDSQYVHVSSVLEVSELVCHECLILVPGVAPPHGKDLALRLVPSMYHSEAQLWLWDSS